MTPSAFAPATAAQPSSPPAVIVRGPPGSASTLGVASAAARGASSTPRRSPRAASKPPGDLSLASPSQFGPSVTDKGKSGTIFEGAWDVSSAQHGDPPTPNSCFPGGVRRGGSIAREGISTPTMLWALSRSGGMLGKSKQFAGAVAEWGRGWPRCQNFSMKMLKIPSWQPIGCFEAIITCFFTSLIMLLLVNMCK